MSSVLESVEWSKPILKLLSHMEELDPIHPTILHIRHTETLHRARNLMGTPQGYSSLSTEKGKQATYELGTLLPKNKKYRLYHTKIERTKETAQELQKGLHSNGANAEIQGNIPVSITVDVSKFQQVTRQERDLGLIIQDVGTRWLAGVYSDSIRVPSLGFAKTAASIMLDNLKSADSECVDVYVSHEVYVAAYMFHWFGIYPKDWVEFLEGFILQLLDDRMIIYTKKGKTERLYPHWWDIKEK